MKTRREYTAWDIRRRLEDNIRMDLKETGYESVDWIYVA
jgi:hypothetical protein